MSEEHILNVAAYRFVTIDDLPELRRQWQVETKDAELRGTILVSPEGVNMFLAGDAQRLRGFLKQVQSDARFKGLEIKESWTDHQPFNRMLVKLKREIISFGVESVEPAKRTSPKLPPSTLQQWLDEGRDVTLLDTRNQYEVELGTFENAVDLKIDSFREFVEAAKQMPEETKKKPVVMFCTGGIRCEKAGPYMESLGFEQIYQLEGGILKYFEQCGGNHYKGDCFVFDQRVAVAADLQPTGHGLCFACQHALTAEELASDQYVPAQSCPYCYQSAESIEQVSWTQREEQLQTLAASQPGSTAYENVRAIHVPRKFANQPAIDFLTGHCQTYSRETWLTELHQGKLTRRNQIIDQTTLVYEGQRIEHCMPETIEPRIASTICVLFEDADYLIVDKPAPLPMHPSGRFNRNTLESIVREVLAPTRVRLVHRLDANTSGVIALCKRYKAARELQSQFESRSVQKQYVALVHGQCQFERWTNSKPISKAAVERHGARGICEDGDGDAATTEFEVLARGDQTTLLAVRPITGRTNQIRVHLWSDGYAIVGDPLYLPDKQLGVSQTKPLEEPPMCLHAESLAFHPISKSGRMTFTALRPAWANLSHAASSQA
jgi:RluA family pseudouridine synthase